MFGLEMLAAASMQAAEGGDRTPLITSAAGQLAVLLAVLAVIFWLDTTRIGSRFFRIIPALLFCYFVPTALSNSGLIPTQAPLYGWVKNFVLPASLVLLTLSLDLHGIIRLGPKAIIMLFAGTVGVIIGGPIALLLCQGLVGEEAWKPMAYLSGSWIGGGANAVALQKSFDVSDAAIAPIIIVDVAVANVWMAFLLFAASRRHMFDRLLRADASAVTELERKMEDFQARVARPAKTGELLMVLALGFGFTYLAHVFSLWLVTIPPFSGMTDYIGDFAWKVVLVSAVGTALSFTRIRDLEGAGASKVGSVMIYLLVACIGAGADFEGLAKAHWFLLLGAVWMLVHVTIMISVGFAIRAPTFFIAVGSKANIGGAASAPVVAGAFNPVLAPVGALLAIVGYVVGTLGGLICIWLCRWVVGA